MKQFQLIVGLLVRSHDDLYIIVKIDMFDINRKFYLLITVPQIAHVK